MTRTPNEKKEEKRKEKRANQINSVRPQSVVQKARWRERVVSLGCLFELVPPLFAQTDPPRASF